jgi:hypothetical protein
LISASSPAASLDTVTHIDFLPERRPDGTIVLHAVVLGPVERLRRLLRRLGRRVQPAPSL